MNLVSVSDEVTITSRDLAELSGRRHADILRSVERLNEDLEKSNERQVALVEYVDKKGEKRPQYILTKFQCELLAMQMDGVTRIKVLKRLKELEANKKPALPTTYKEALLELIKKEEEKEMLEAKIEEDKPKVNFANAVSSSISSVSVGDWAKAISKDKGIIIGRNRVFKWLRKEKFLMRNNRPYQRYIDNGYFEVIESSYISTKGLIPTFSTKITGKGQIELLGKLEKYLTEEK